MPGAFGTQERPWREDERLRARALARLLDARPWQLQASRGAAECCAAPACCGRDSCCCLPDFFRLPSQLLNALLVCLPVPACPCPGVQRLDFLAEQHAETAGRRGLLDHVMLSKHEFAERHPGFMDWLQEKRQQWREEREARWREEAAAAEAQQRQQRQLAAGEAAAATVQEEAGGSSLDGSAGGGCELPPAAAEQLPA